MLSILYRQYAPTTRERRAHLALMAMSSVETKLAPNDKKTAAEAKLAPREGSSKDTRMRSVA